MVKLQPPDSVLVVRSYQKITSSINMTLSKPNIIVFATVTSAYSTKMAKQRSRKPRRTIAPGIQFYDSKDLYKIPRGSSPAVRQTQVGYVKIAFFDRSISLRLSYHRKFVSIRNGGPCPRRCAGRGIRAVINNVGCRGSLFSTGTAHFSVTCIACSLRNN